MTIEERLVEIKKFLVRPGEWKPNYLAESLFWLLPLVRSMRAVCEAAEKRVNGWDGCTCGEALTAQEEPDARKHEHDSNCEWWQSRNRDVRAALQAWRESER